jgi:hypothetical protein
MRKPRQSPQKKCNTLKVGTGVYIKKVLYVIAGVPASVITFLVRDKARHYGVATAMAVPL